MLRWQKRKKGSRKRSINELSRPSPGLIPSQIRYRQNRFNRKGPYHQIHVRMRSPVCLIHRRWLPAALKRNSCERENEQRKAKAISENSLAVDTRIAYSDSGTPWS